MRAPAVIAVLALVAVAACRSSRHEPAATGTGTAPKDSSGAKPAPHADYAVARKSFRTKLLSSEPSPQPWQPVPVPSDAREIDFTSGGYDLKAWRSSPKPGVTQAPAVLFLHGGFAFDQEDWDMTRPFRDAGYVVLMPRLRGENGLPGAFSLYFDEVDDVLAAAEVLAKQPDVNASRIYVTGHSAGGVLAMLAAMGSKRFRAVASLSGNPDTSTIDEALIPFDQTDENEFRIRSPLTFATSFKCPARLYYGDQEPGLVRSTTELTRQAIAAGLDVAAIRVAGDHSSMRAEAIPLALAFFQQQR